MLIVGWFTSTRHIDFFFSAEGVPCSGHGLTLDVMPKEGIGRERLVIELGQDGFVRLPGRYRNATFQAELSNDGVLVASLFGAGFSKGLTRIELVEGSLWKRVHEYRFLFFRKVNVQRGRIGQGE